MDGTNLPIRSEPEWTSCGGASGAVFVKELWRRLRRRACDDALNERA